MAQRQAYITFISYTFLCFLHLFEFIPFSYITIDPGRGAKYYYHRPTVRRCVCSLDTAIRYVLPVLWMTSRFHIMNQIQIQAWSLRRSELLTVTRQMAPINCAPGGEVGCRRLPCYAITVITFCVSRRRRKMYCGHPRLCVCLSVCLCACPRPHAYTIARTRM